MIKSIPWVEKYRPRYFSDIIMSNTNDLILNNMINNKKFMNIILYGPPGTGKTSTVINIINSYQDKYEKRDNTLVMHLNASDDRGIDTIRNQINTFVTTKHIWGTGTKFVVLDEVDYMTRSAQYSLKYLIDQNIPNVRFCLICNYIYKLESSLTHHFIKLRFNSVPKDKVFLLLKHIVTSEKLKYTNDDIYDIQSSCGSDIRRMINIIQCDSTRNTNTHRGTLTTKIDTLFDDKNTTYNDIIDLTYVYNISINGLIYSYIDHFVKHNKIETDIIDFIECILNINRIDDELLAKYFTSFFINYKLK